MFTYCISGDDLTISTRFKNGDVLFSWYNPQKTYRYYYLTINNQTVGWIPDPVYTVKDALMYDCISITVKGEVSSKDYNLTYNGELEACCMTFYFNINASDKIIKDIL